MTSNPPASSFGRPPSHRRPAPFGHFLFGSTYYPEHWDAETRADDARRIAAAGFNVVRMAEFAWDRIEPRPDEYDFALFDEVIDELGRTGVGTIMCTPTATPPRWLTLAHPEMLRIDANGVRQEHGSRQHCCHASPTFREHSQRITRVMAEHYRDNPHVIGWQTDNEFHCHFAECHCDSCQAAFAEFLRGEFENDIDALNQTWGTAFWAQTYNRFEDVLTPRDGKPTYLNPAHRLDYLRYLSHAVTRFQRDQVEILRETQNQWFVTHNGLFGHIDYRGEFIRDLDVLGYDCYPFFDADPAHRPLSQAFNLDRARAWSGNFIIPEQQSGAGGQGNYAHDNPEPGEMRQMAYRSIARGADSLLFFRWRTCRFGAEEYWRGILDHDNVPRRRYWETAEIGAEIARLGPAVLGTSVRVDVAIAASDVDVTDGHRILNMGLPGGDDVARTLHEACLRRRYAVGLVHPSDDLSGLKLYIVPHWPMFHPEWVPNLEQYVRGGGTLVIGARTATRDWNNNVIADPGPGCLRDLAGVDVEEYGRQNNPDARPLFVRIGRKRVRSRLWYEALNLGTDAEAFARWEGRHLDHAYAISSRQLGQGHVLYVGTYLTEELVEALLSGLSSLARLRSAWPGAPAGVEVVAREGAGKRLWFFLNSTDEPITLPRTPRGTDLLTGQGTGGCLVLPRYGVAAIQA